jgi:hypothetical protein
MCKDLATMLGAEGVHVRRVPAHWRVTGLQRAEQLAGLGARGRVPKLGHGPDLDDADPIPGQADQLGHLVEAAFVSAVEAMLQIENPLLDLVEARG